MPYQVSVFAENKPGKIERLTEVLKAGDINIRAVTISDAGDYGIIKLLLDNPEAGCVLLKERGIPATLKEIIAVRVDDRVGGLHDVAAALSGNGINVQDAYGFIVEKCRLAVFIFQVDDPHAAGAVLRQAGFSVLKDEELYTI